eukprot:symbB.v1.2.021039.t1/scaffold1797.1/size100932/6
MSQHVVMDVLSKDPVKHVLPPGEDDEESGWPHSRSDAEWNEWNLAKVRKRKVKKILLKHPRKGDNQKPFSTRESDQDNSNSEKTTITEKTTVSYRSSVLETRKKMSVVVGWAQAQNNAITAQRKEACQMLRFFVFGAVGNEHAKTAEEKDAIFQQRIGERWQVTEKFHGFVHLFWHWTHICRCNFCTTCGTNWTAISQDVVTLVSSMSLQR